MSKYILYFAIFLLTVLTAYSRIDLIAVPQAVDFGKVFKDSPKMVKEVRLINKNQKAVAVKNFRIENDPANLFSVTTAFPIFIPGQTGRILEVELNPSTNVTGPYKAELVLFEPGKQDDTLRIRLFADIITQMDPFREAKLKIPDLSVKVGSTFNLPLIVENLDDGMQQPDRYSFYLTFNASVLAPQGNFRYDTTIYGIRIILIEGTITKRINDGDTLLSIPFTAGLGDAVMSSVKIRDFGWFEQGKLLRVNNYYSNGTITISDIFYDQGIPRLVTNNKDDLYIYPMQNPVTEDFTIRIKYKGSPSLALFTVNGEIIAEYTGDIPFAAETSEIIISVSKSLFANKGVYILRLAQNGFFVSQMILVD